MVRLAISMGDPAGVGPELCVRAATAPEFNDVDFRFYGAQSLLDEAFRRWSGGTPAPKVVFDSGLIFDQVPVGTASARCGRSAYDALTAATEAVPPRSARTAYGSALTRIEPSGAVIEYL